MLRWIKNLFKKKKCEHRFNLSDVNDFNNADPNCKKCGQIIFRRYVGHVYRYIRINDKEFGLLKVK